MFGVDEFHKKENDFMSVTEINENKIMDIDKDYSENYFKFNSSNPQHMLQQDEQQKQLKICLAKTENSNISNKFLKTETTVTTTSYLLNETNTNSTEIKGNDNQCNNEEGFLNNSTSTKMVQNQQIGIDNKVNDEINLPLSGTSSLSKSSSSSSISNKEEKTKSFDNEQNENDCIMSDNEDDDEDDDNRCDDMDSSDSKFSNLSGFSDISSQGWKPMSKPLNWIQKQLSMGASPREILSQILLNGAQITSTLNDITIWRMLANILSEPPKRQKLKNINTIEDVLHLLKVSKKIIVLTGAGVSVSCGIPDFRSNNGIYSRLAKDFPDLPNPQAMFDINYFSKDPRPFYKFAREIYPGQFQPSPCHRFIKLLEKKQKLLRNYTQNIDTLEQVAGIKNVIECHGSFATATCTKCKYKTTADEIRDDIFAQRIPLCPKCQPNKTTNNEKYSSENRFSNSVSSNDDNSESSISYSELVQNGIMKPDIVFFGEGLSDAFHNAMTDDRHECDLLIVIGSSLKVRPVALIPSSIPPEVPQILINREQLHHLEFDVELLGDSDVIINYLCQKLSGGWEEVCWNSNILNKTTDLKSIPINDEQTNVTIAIPMTITNGCSSPSCDSGFDSSSSHPVYNRNKQNMSEEDDQDDDRSSKINHFNVNEQQKQQSYQNLNDINKGKNCLKKSRNLSVDSLKDSSTYDSSSTLSTLQTNLSSNNIISRSCSVDDDVDDEVDDNICNSNNTKFLENSQQPCSSSTSSSMVLPEVSTSNNFSIADRLYENTFYYNSLYSYVFPGAQVYWNSSSTMSSQLSSSETDSDEDDEDDEDDDDNCGGENYLKLENSNLKNINDEENSYDENPILIEMSNKNYNCNDNSSSSSDDDNENSSDDNIDSNIDGGFPPKKKTKIINY